MKKAILAGLIALMTVPALANNDLMSEENGTQAEMNLTPEEMGSIDPNMMPDWDDDWDRDRDRERRRGGWRCLAENRFRQRFIGRDWNRWQAQREALRSCQRRSDSRCYIVRCWRGGRGGGW